MFEKIILSRLNKHFKPIEEQHTFRPGHSTIAKLIGLVNNLKLNYTNGEKMAAVFLDMEKAFDRVWWAGLLHKLLKAGVPV